MHSKFISQMTTDEFKSMVIESIEIHLNRKLETILEIGDQNGSFHLNSVKSTKPREEYLTRGQVSKHLQISLPTLHNYVKLGLIKSYRIGGKVRFKLKEVDQALTERNFTSVMRKGGNHVS